MESKKKHSFNQLTIEVTNKGDKLELVWLGRSTDRNPGAFLRPLLMDAINDAKKENKPVEINFKSLEFMNSSTITPVIKILEFSRQNKINLRIIYNNQEKWQELSFAALKIFQTDDKSIEITGE